MEIKKINNEKDVFIVDDQILNKNIWSDGNVYDGSNNSDEYKINSEKDLINEQQNGGIDTASAIISYELPNNVQNLVLENVVKKEVIDGVNCEIYGNPEDNRWIFDYNQNDSGVVKVNNAVRRLGFNPTYKL